VAESIKEQWAKIGANVIINKVPSVSLDNDYIASRNYDILLIGENIGSDSDPYSYWHSTQVAAPGLNLASFANGEVDKLLEEARQSSDTNVRIKDYNKFQDIIAEEYRRYFYTSQYIFIKFITKCRN